MANVYVACGSVKASMHNEYPAYRIRSSYAHDVYGQHRLVEKPAAADVILVATNYSYGTANWGLKTDRLYRQYANKAVLFDSSDYPSPIYGGLCASWQQNLQSYPDQGLGWCYFHPNSAEPRIGLLTWPRSGPRYLWSFMGSVHTHSIRSKLLKLQDPEAYTLDTSAVSQANLRGNTSAGERRSFLASYVHTFQESSFVVAPRGIGSSSMRIFEAMRAGRVPVILSDAWVPPPFVNWKKCSLRIAERCIGELPTIVRNYRDRAYPMGNTARREWERVFGPEGLFHFTTEAALRVLRGRKRASLLQHAKRYMQLTRPHNVRAILRHVKQRYA